MIRPAVKFKFFVCMGLLATATNLPAQEGDPATGIGLQPNAAVTSQLDEASLLQKSSYIIGYNMTSEWMGAMEEQGVEFDKTSLIEGINKAVEGAAFDMTDEEVQSIMKAFQKVVEKKQVTKMKSAAEVNKAEGEAYMAENAKKAGVNTLDSGVQYEVLTAGTGEVPTEDDTVRIHYHGMLPNGEVFDSSVKHPSGRPPEPVEYPVNGFVKGFSSALLAMKVGDKWKVTIPSELGYGLRGPGMVGPNRTLIFELELLGIVK